MKSADLAMPYASLRAFWQQDMPCLDGRVRFLWFANLILMTEFAYPPPFQRSARFSQGWVKQQADLFRFHQAFGFRSPTMAMFVDAALPWYSLDFLMVAQGGLVASYAACALGVFSWVARLGAAVCCMILQFAQVRHAAHSHSHYVLRDALLCLVFEPFDPRFSLDALLCRRAARPASSSTQPQPSQRGSVARKMLLVNVVVSLFFAGASKLWLVGPSWGRGDVILASAAADCTSGAAWPALCEFLVTRGRWLARPLATAGCAIELLSLVCLVWPSARPWYFATAIGMHCGIKMVMKASFPFQAVVYLLCFDWEDLGRQLAGLCRGRSATRPLGCCDEFCDGSTGPTRGGRDSAKGGAASTRGVTVCTWAACAWASVAVLAATFRVDFWPLTSWALYCWQPAAVMTRGVPRLVSSPEWTASDAQAHALECLTVPFLTPTCFTAKNHAEVYARVAGRRMRIVFIMRAANVSLAAHGLVHGGSGARGDLYILYRDFVLADISLTPFQASDVRRTLALADSGTRYASTASRFLERHGRNGSALAMATRTSRSLPPNLLRRASLPFEATPAGAHRGLRRSELTKELRMLLLAPTASDLTHRPLGSLLKTPSEESDRHLRTARSSLFAAHVLTHFTARASRLALRPYFVQHASWLHIQAVQVHFRLCQRGPGGKEERYYVQLGEARVASRTR